MNEQQKAELLKLFDEIKTEAEMLMMYVCHGQDRNVKIAGERLDQLRSTFPDRVAEILYPHPLLEKIVNLYDDHRVDSIAFRLAITQAREILKPKEGEEV